jgi:hypothetical protein
MELSEEDRRRRGGREDNDGRNYSNIDDTGCSSRVGDGGG